ncbi:MAG: GAF domain-containing protein, partial [Dehalococcoidia bacterium]|nr:GAF domain-containing protein [Dehalococcoidia bacterium]
MKTVVPGLLSDSSDLQSAFRAEPSGFPFRCELSLAPLIAFWTRPANEGSALGVLAQMVGDDILKASGLLGTITDASVIAEHREIVDVLMAAVFPPASWEQDYGAATIPFQLRGFYATPSMQRLLMSADGAVQGRVNLDPHMVGAMRLAYAYALVLKRVYGIELDVDYPVIITVTDPDTGLDRHFRMLFDWQFVDVVPQGAVPTLTEDLEHRLHANLLDAEWLREVLPPEKFVLRGVTIFRALEVTDQEVLSALKRDLIDRESIVSDTRFLGLQARLRTLFRRPELRLGLAAIDRERVLVLNCEARHVHECIFADSTHLTVSEFAGSLFERAVREGQPILVPDLTMLPNRTVIEEQLIQSGARSFLCAPLHYQNQTIGTFALSSPNPCALDATHLPKVHEVLPLFSMAVRRSMEELNARIQTQIKERFTAIHPVVEWRFRKAVLDGIERHGVGPGLDLPPIVFDNVYPLYALSDIRGSSIQRALAIQADL